MQIISFKKILLLVLLSAVILSLAPAVFAVEPVIIDKSIYSTSINKIGKYIEYIEDKENILSLTDVINSKNWNITNQDVINFSFSRSAYWFRFSLTNLNPNKIKLYFIIDFMIMNLIEFYYNDRFGNYHKTEAGDLIPFIVREIEDRRPVFNITVNANNKQIYYIHIKNQGTVKLPIKIQNENIYFKNLLIEYVLLSLLFGLIICVIIYNFLVLVIIREKIYLFFLLMSFGIILIELCYSGFALQFLWPNSPIWNNKCLPFSLLITTVGICLYCREFISFKKLFPSIDKIFIVLVIINSIWALYSLIGNYYICIVFTNILAIITSIFGFILSILILIKYKSRQVIIFFSSFFVLIIGVILFTLTDHSILPVNLLTTYSKEFGMAIALLIFSFAIADKINVLKNEKENTQEIVIKHLQKTDKLKDEFLSNTSHELKTPLHGIIGLADSVVSNLSRYSPDEIKQNLSLIITSGKRLSNLINDILDFSRLKNNDIIMQFSQVDLKANADAVIAISRHLVGEKKLELNNFIEHTLPLVKADEARLQQILLNLVDNAIKFTQEGHVSIYAKEYTEDKKQYSNFIQVTISDTGIGIPADKQDVIFNSFEQAGEAIAREYGGTGLGLSIAKRLVELQHGKIWIESAVNKGSDFHFTIPVSLQQERDLIIPQEITYDSTAVNFLIQEKKPKYIDRLEKRKILAVDDDIISQQLLTNYLESDNYYIKTASNGAEALDLLNSGRFDLILLDIMMPQISGLEVCQKLRKDYELYELPVIMLTIKDSISDITAGFNAGANDYLVKPIKKEELLSRINTLVSLKEAFAEIKELKNNIELIVENIPEGILSINSDLRINYANNKFKELFQINENNINKELSELFEKEIYNNIYNFVKFKKDKHIFEWITGSAGNPVLISVILKFISKKFILIAVSEIKDVLAEKELETCFYIVRGHSERETAKLLHKGRTTVNSNKVRAKEKLKQGNYISLLNRLG